jgi:transposase-like protein
MGQEINKAKMGAALDCIAGGCSYEETARRIGVTSRSIFNWRMRSRKSDPQTLLTWGDQSGQFEQHLNNAIAMSIVHMESEARQAATIGFEEQVVFQGRVQWREDPRMVGLDDAQCDLLFGHHDRLLRDDKGNALPLTIKRKPSDALVLRMLASHMRNTYGEHVTSDVNVNLGVLQLPRKGDTAEGPKLVEHSPVDAFTPELANKQAERPKIAIGRPAKDSAELETWNKEGDFKSAPVEFVKNTGETIVVGGQEIPTQPNPDIRRDPNDPVRVALERQLAEHNAKVAAQQASGKPPQAPPVVQKFSATEEGPTENSGTGGPADGVPQPGATAARVISQDKIDALPGLYPAAVRLLRPIRCRRSL